MLYIEVERFEDVNVRRMSMQKSLYADKRRLRTYACVTNRMNG